MALIDNFPKAGLQDDLNFYQKVIEYSGQRVIDLETEEVIGTKKYQRTDTRCQST